MEFLCWIKQLITSHSFWGTVIGALVGGGIAYCVARMQVKSSEMHQEKQRREIVEHERMLELIRIQLDECRASIIHLIRLPNDLLTLQSLLKKDVQFFSHDMLKTEDGVRNQQQISDLIINLSSGLIAIELSMKICDFSEEDIKISRDFREKVYRTLDFITSRELSKYTQEIIKYPPIIDVLHKKFIKKQELLISKMK